MTGLSLSAMCVAQSSGVQDSHEATSKRIQELQSEQLRLLEEIRRDLARLPQLPTQRADEDEALKIQRQKRRELAKLLEQVELRVSAEAPQLRSRFASAFSSEGVLRDYYDRLRRRVEHLGNQNFPREGGVSVYGVVAVLVSLAPDGQILRIEVVESPSEKLTGHTLGLLRRLEPFEPFPAELASTVNQLVIGTQFNYTKN